MTENACTLLGRLGRDAEVRTTPSGETLASLSLGTYRPSRDPENRKTDWHRIIVWDPHQVVQLARKGDWVFVTRAAIQYETWEDKEGRQRTSSEVVAGRGSRVLVIGQLPAGTSLGVASGMDAPAASAGGQPADEAAQGPPGVAEDDDLPF